MMNDGNSFNDQKYNHSNHCSLACRAPNFCLKDQIARQILSAITMQTFLYRANVIQILCKGMCIVLLLPMHCTCLAIELLNNSNFVPRPKKGFFVPPFYIEGVFFTEGVARGKKCTQPR